VGSIPTWRTNCEPGRNPSSTPVISLLVTFVHEENFLPTLIGDIKSQTRPFAEVIFCCDGTSVETRESIRAAGFRVIDAGPPGPPQVSISRARNLLLQEAKSPWIHWHDADDRIRPRFVEAFADRLPEVPGEDAYFCAFLRTQLESTWSEEYRYGDLPPETDWVAYHLTGFIHHNQIVFPREAVRAAGGYNESLVLFEDVNFHIRVAARGMRFIYLDELLAEFNYRSDSAGGVTRQSEARRLENSLRSSEDLFPLLSPRHRRLAAEPLAELAVRFTSYPMRDEMERALDLARRSAPGERLLPTSPNLRRLARVFGLAAVCRARYFFHNRLKPKAAAA